MATASSAQREPSMEEILASIRRIIEDSDSGRKQPGDAEESRADELRQDLEPVPSAVAAADIDAFRAELHAAPEVGKSAVMAEVQAPAVRPEIARMEVPPRADPALGRTPTTLAEVSARVAAEPAPAASRDAPAAAAEVATSEAVVADWRREIAAVGEQAKAMPDRSIRKPVPQPEVSASEPAAEPAIERSSSSDAPTGTAQARAAANEAHAVRPAIVSEHTGRQVAAAFGELSDAFASRSKKTFDEMAEEMLRPMLQDWLDNNLPTLVERLVREEIERVARGAQ
ncbi:PopZ family protein [Mesorhizobium sp. BH1-1-4]|uniref:PopZ family protein n=1 Tax=Mesorhizobium sp. BH1-1-4 TaxID=2876662 RepID=UPI001CD04950|nr:PopZ family protein [Mesorhizobium sp. BH1-1-4]MBZ9997925.1 PopZ family protein [Mesorhizobium sp. BH1-1-4]